MLNVSNKKLVKLDLINGDELTSVYGFVQEMDETELMILECNTYRSETYVYGCEEDFWGDGSIKNVTFVQDADVVHEQTLQLQLTWVNMVVANAADDVVCRLKRVVDDCILPISIDDIMDDFNAAVDCNLIKNK